MHGSEQFAQVLVLLRVPWKDCKTLQSLEPCWQDLMSEWMASVRQASVPADLLGLLGPLVYW